MVDFRKSATRKNEIKAKLLDVEARLEELEAKECKDFDELRELTLLRDQCSSLKEQMTRVESCADMMDYYYMTCDIISKYDELETDPNLGKVTIDDFFRDYSNEEISSSRPAKTVNKRELLEQYLEVTCPDYVRRQIEDSFSYCTTCDKEMVMKKDQATYICTFCGQTNSVLVDGEAGKVAIPDGQKYSVYQRKNHFKEWLNQIQAKETTDIPEEVLHLVLVELNKIRYNNLADLEPITVRNILKKLNLSKYYENVFHIIYRINGLQPPTLSREVEEKLLHLFKQIEEPFRLYKKKGRKNILRYSYILYKLCELLELDDFLRCFRLLKNRTKLMEQDTVWAAICKHLHWQFIASM